MKIKEISGLDIFEQLQTVNKDLALFTISDGTILDTVYKYKSGEKTTAPILSEKSTNEIANLINVMYGKKWDNYINGYLTTYPDLLKYFGNHTVVKTTEKVAPYETDDFYNENEKTTETTGAINPKDIETIIKNLREVVIYDIIFSDVDSLIALSIYD